MNHDPDLHNMALVLDEARAALAAGDYPVGAALVVDGALWGSARNALFSDGRTTAHAEHTLIAAHSARLRAAALGQASRTICLYTTLEPCLMCLGIAVLHKVTRIVYACPDPHGGATRLDYTRIGSVYPRLWPAIVAGPLRRESCDLIIQFLRTDKFLNAPVMLPDFLALQDAL
ncbi:MAG: nucleoside deaminase [Chloroflexales bacterium]|nr:nucleoside deaminase [Chloroflexales bacterium]